MVSEGIEAVFLETHNWGRAACFFQDLGYELEFETDHNSGQQRSKVGRPLFNIAEIPLDRAPGFQLVLRVPDADAAGLDELGIDGPFEETHFGTKMTTVRGRDGRVWGLQASLNGTDMGK